MKSWKSKMQQIPMRIQVPNWENLFFFFKFFYTLIEVEESVLFLLKNKNEEKKRKIAFFSASINKLLNGRKLHKITHTELINA